MAGISCSDLVESIADLLLNRDLKGNIIDNALNNQILNDKNNSQNYTLSILENHIANDESILIGEYSILILTNISAEKNYNTIRLILSKGKLFQLIQNKITNARYTDDILICIVNLIYNISLIENQFEFTDYYDVPELIGVVFPLVIQKDVVNTSLMCAFKKIVSLADDEQIYQIVNFQYDLITLMSGFVQQCDTRNLYHCECSMYILEIFDYFCNQYESLTQQIVDLGIFDPIAHIMNQDIPNELLVLCLRVLEVIFSKTNSQINEHFLVENNFNNNQYLTRKIINLASICQSEIKNAALNCISQLLSGCNSKQCKLVFDEKLMKILLESLESDSVKKETISEVIIGICKLIFIGNLNSTDTEKNPYLQSFLCLQGDKIIEQVQDKLNENAYKSSNILLNLVLYGNEEEKEQI